MNFIERLTHELARVSLTVGDSKEGYGTRFQGLKTSNKVPRAKKGVGVPQAAGMGSLSER